MIGFDKFSPARLSVSTRKKQIVGHEMGFVGLLDWIFMSAAGWLMLRAYRLHTLQPSSNTEGTLIEYIVPLMLVE